MVNLVYLVCLALIGIFALVNGCPQRHYGDNRSLRCPRGNHGVPKLRNTPDGQTIPNGGFIRKHCGCILDEFDNELADTRNDENSEHW